MALLQRLWHGFPNVLGKVMAELPSFLLFFPIVTYFEISAILEKSHGQADRWFCGYLVFFIWFPQKSGSG